MHLKDVCTLTHICTQETGQDENKKKLQNCLPFRQVAVEVYEMRAGPSTAFSLNLPHVYATHNYNMQRPEGLLH